MHTSYYCLTPGCEAFNEEQIEHESHKSYYSPPEDMPYCPRCSNQMSEEPADVSEAFDRIHTFFRNSEAGLVEYLMDAAAAHYGDLDTEEKQRHFMLFMEEISDYEEVHK